MTNKELEDEIWRAIQSGEGRLVPLDEVGGDEEDYTNCDISDDMYALYADSCHLENSLDPRQSSENVINHKDDDKFAVIGRIGYFQWYALSAYYDSTIHKMNSDKVSSNEHHKASAADEFFEGPGEHLAKAINDCNELVNFLRDPIVVNSSDMFPSGNFNLLEMETRLRNFLGIDLFPSESVMEKAEQGFKINIGMIRGKDVIIPLLYASNANLRIFGLLAQQIAKLGANTVIGVFATRVVPSLDGKEGRVTEEMQVASFSPRFGIRF